MRELQTQLFESTMCHDRHLKAKLIVCMINKGGKFPKKLWYFVGGINGLMPFERTIEQTTEVMPPPPPSHTHSQYMYILWIVPF